MVLNDIEVIQEVYNELIPASQLHYRNSIFLADGILFGGDCLKVNTLRSPLTSLRKFTILTDQSTSEFHPCIRSTSTYAPQHRTKIRKTCPRPASTLPAFLSPLLKSTWNDAIHSMRGRSQFPPSH